MIICFVKNRSFNYWYDSSLIKEFLNDVLPNNIPSTHMISLVFKNSKGFICRRIMIKIKDIGLTLKRITSAIFTSTFNNNFLKFRHDNNFKQNNQPNKVKYFCVFRFLEKWREMKKRGKQKVEKEDDNLYVGT